MEVNEVKNEPNRIYIHRIDILSDQQQKPNVQSNQIIVCQPFRCHVSDDIPHLDGAFAMVWFGLVRFRYTHVNEKRDRFIDKLGASHEHL